MERKAKKITYKILEQIEDVRYNDFKLYALVAWEFARQKGKVAQLEKFSFTTILYSAYELGLPSFESVTRARRKFAEDNPEYNMKNSARRKKERQFKSLYKCAKCGNEIHGDMFENDGIYYCEDCVYQSDRRYFLEDVEGMSDDAISDVEEVYKLEAE